MEPIYLDWAATAIPDDQCLREMYHVARSCFGNPSSRHDAGKESKKRLEEARVICSSYLGVKPEHIIFTSGATEANNAILYSLLGRGQKASLITTSIEHPSGYEPAKRLGDLGRTVKLINTTSGGFVDLDHLEALIDKHTAMISVLYVQNETAAIQPLKDISHVIREKEKEFGHSIHFHSDMVQALGKISIDVNEIDVDSAAFSGHKIGGPKGVGILYVKSAAPLLYTGGEQEYGLRPGTENLPAIWGFAQAMQKFLPHVESFNQQAARLKAVLIRELLNCGFCSLLESGSRQGYSPFITTVFIPPIPGEVIARVMNDKGFAVSTGSACSKSRQKKMRTLKNMSIPEEKADSAIRISTGYTTTEEQIHQFVDTLQEVIPPLLRIGKQ